MHRQFLAVISHTLYILFHTGTYIYWFILAHTYSCKCIVKPDWVHAHQQRNHYHGSHIFSGVAIHMQHFLKKNQLPLYIQQSGVLPNYLPKQEVVSRKSDYLDLQGWVM